MVSLLAGCLPRCAGNPESGGALETAEELIDNLTLVHGVNPIKVTSTGSGEALGYKYTWHVMFYNVGKLGGDPYTGAFMEIKYIDAPKDFQEAVGARYGYFTGGPNGDVYLNLTKDENASPTLYFHLKDGKELITIEGVN